MLSPEMYVQSLRGKFTIIGQPVAFVCQVSFCPCPCFAPRDNGRMRKFISQYAAPSFSLLYLTAASGVLTQVSRQSPWFRHSKQKLYGSIMEEAEIHYVDTASKGL